METILIVCGAGASSTFLASRIRAIARERGLDVTAQAVSLDGLGELLPTATVLLVGPHLADAFAELEARAAVSGVRAALLPADVFGAAGASEALALALNPATTPTEGLPHA